MSNYALIIDELFRCVEKIGYNKTLSGIRKIQFEEVEFTDKRVEYVITEVSAKMNIPIYEIMYGNGRKNERKYAIGFCAYYLTSPQFYNIDMLSVKTFLNKGSNLCYIYSKDVSRLNPSYKSHAKLCDIKSELDILFKKNLNKKQL